MHQTPGAQGHRTAAYREVAQSRAIIKSWEVISVEQLIPLSWALGYPQATDKSPCSHQISTEAAGISQGAEDVEEGWRAASYICSLAIAPCRTWRPHRSSGRAVQLIHEGGPARSQDHPEHSPTTGKWSRAGESTELQQQTSSHQTRARQKMRSEVKLGNPNNNSGTAEDSTWYRCTYNTAQTQTNKPQAELKWGSCAYEPRV